MVLGVTSVSVFLQLYIDQCSLLLKHILDVAMSASFFFPSWSVFKTFPVQEHQWNIYIQTVANKTMSKMVSIGLLGQGCVVPVLFLCALDLRGLPLPMTAAACPHSFSEDFSNSSFQCVFLKCYSSPWNLQLGPESRMTEPWTRAVLTDESDQ